MPGKSLGITLPTPGGSPSGTPGPDYSSELHAALTAIINDLEPKVRASELNIDSLLDIQGQTLKDIALAKFTDQSSPQAGASNLRCFQSVLGDAYFVNGAGVAVRITNGSQLDIAAVGGFTGDYGAGGVDAEASYDDASSMYEFYADTPTGLMGRMLCGDVRIRRMVAGVTNHVAVMSPASLAASYNFVLPAGLPAAPAAGEESCLTIDESGQVAFTEDPNFNSVSTVGDVVVGARLDMSAGNEKHGVRGKFLHATEAFSTEFDDWALLGSAGLQTAIANSHLYFGVPLRPGDRITKIKVRHNPQDGGDNKTLILRKGTGDSNSVVHTEFWSGATGWRTDETAAINHTVVADEWLFIDYASGTIDDIVCGIEIEYDRP